MPFVWGPADGTAGRLAAVVVGLELLGGGPRPHVAPDEAHLGEGEEVGEVWLGREGVLESSADRVETRRVLVVAREPDPELGDPRGDGLDRARPATDQTGQDQDGEDEARDAPGLPAAQPPSPRSRSIIASVSAYPPSPMCW